MSTDCPDYRIVFIDVGQGDCTLISRLVDKRAVLVDVACFGPIFPLLKDVHLEAIFISHLHHDHIGGLPQVINWLRENGSSAKLFVNFQNVVGRELERISRAIHEGEKDKILSVDPAHAKSVLRSRVIRIFGASFIVLWPNYGNIFGHFDDKNQDSVILTFRVGKFSLLLGGDAPGSVWSSLNLGDLKAKVLKFPHHGGTLQDHPDFWTSDQLIKAVDPDYIVVPVGKNNCYDHPSQEFNQAVKKNSHRVFLYTRDEGDIEFRVHTQTGILERLVN